MASQNQHRVYIPTNARANQYILAEFKPDDDFYACFSDYRSAYQRVARQLFALCDDAELYNVHMLVNDKLPIVRFHEEAYCLETQRQQLFFYNPRYHEAHQLHGCCENRARKVRLLFLATGEDIRAHSADFHRRVAKVLSALQEQLPGDANKLKVRDHQHLTYDLFARAKGHKESYGYKLRALAPRYEARGCPLPSHRDLTYARFTLPLTRQLKTQLLDASATDYGNFYSHIEDAFISACEAKRLPRRAMVANGRTPLIRHRDIDTSAHNEELEKLSFEPGKGEIQSHVLFDAANLVQSIDFVIVAGVEDHHDMGYGRFMNQVESVIKALCNSLQVNPERQDINTRFYQHLSYSL
ncbi:DUF3083 family protein [Pseudoalteromonas ruthenica]|uniref:DUF3083 family protein n=1 Tax=Pseudoalteromonas ruthenica TaxID=151081 RepID=UPI00241D9ED9|nr:DUF3083 family protein [Pseudoalteromonas ruthenica]|tara:strand:+ start:5618 stop:6682 length:1065 start_codon:yes stop_codon:yes gene_type:complete